MAITGSNKSSQKNKRSGIKVGIDFDLNKGTRDLHVDAMVLMLDTEGKLVSDNHFIFYNNPKSPDGSVEHLLDLLLDSNDSEQIIVDQSKIDNLVKRIIFFVNIQDADKKNQSFEPVNNLRIKFTNLPTNEEIAEYVPDKDNNYKNSNLIVLSEFFYINNEWQISALGDYYRIKLSEFIDILSSKFGYDKFKQEYFKNYKSRESSNYSALSIIEKDIEEQHYKILECSKESSAGDVKRKYKELVKSFHPDILRGLNLHKDIIEFANMRFKQIKDAYEFIKLKRGFH